MCDWFCTAGLQIPQTLRMQYRGAVTVCIGPTHAQQTKCSPDACKVVASEQQLVHLKLLMTHPENMSMCERLSWLSAAHSLHGAEMARAITGGITNSSDDNAAGA